MKYILNYYLAIFLNLLFLTFMIGAFSQNEIINNLDFEKKTKSLLLKKSILISERYCPEQDYRLTKSGYISGLANNLKYADSNFIKGEECNIIFLEFPFENNYNKGMTSFYYFEELSENQSSNFGLNPRIRSGMYFGIGIPVLLLYNIDNYSDIPFETPREYALGVAFVVPMTTFLSLQPELGVSNIKSKGSFVHQEYSSIIEYHNVNINSFFIDHVFFLKYSRFFGKWSLDLQGGTLVKYQIKNKSEHLIKQEYSYGGQNTKINKVKIRPVHIGYKTGVGINYFLRKGNALSLNLEFYSTFGNNSRIEARAIRLIYFYKP